MSYQKSLSKMEALFTLNYIIKPKEFHVELNMLLHFLAEV